MERPLRLVGSRPIIGETGVSRGARRCAGPRWFVVKSMCRCWSGHRSPRRTEMPRPDPAQAMPDCRPKPAWQRPECAAGSRPQPRLDSPDSGGKYQARGRRLAGCPTGCVMSAPPSLSRPLHRSAAAVPSQASAVFRLGGAVLVWRPLRPRQHERPVCLCRKGIRPCADLLLLVAALEQARGAE